MSEARINFTSNTSHFESGAKKVHSSLNDIKNTALGVGTALGALGVLNAAKSAVSGLTDLLKSSSNAAASVETLKTQLDVLTGSGEKAGKLLSQIRGLGAKTPLEQSDLQQATKTLLAFGIASEDVLPTLQQLGDISMGNGEKLQSLARVFGQVSAAGTLMKEDINQMIDIGFNPLTELVGMTGGSMETMLDQVSKGKITINDLKTAMAVATGAGGRFNGMMNKIANTTEGMQSNLSDTIEDLKISLGEGVNVGLKTAIGELNTELPKVKNDIREIGIDIGNIIAKIVPQVKSVIQEISDAVNKGEFWSMIGDKLENKLQEQSGGKDSWKDLGPYLSGLAGISTIFIGQKLQPIFANIIKSIVTTIGGMVSSNTALITAEATAAGQIASAVFWPLFIGAIVGGGVGVAYADWNIDRKKWTNNKLNETRKQQNLEIEQMANDMYYANKPNKAQQDLIDNPPNYYSRMGREPVSDAVAQRNKRILEEELTLQENVNRLLEKAKTIIAGSGDIILKEKPYYMPNYDVMGDTIKEIGRIVHFPELLLRENADKKAFDARAPLASNMQRIGGAGKFGHHPMLSETQKTNNILTKHTTLLAKIAGGGKTATFA